VGGHGQLQQLSKFSAGHKGVGQVAQILASSGIGENTGLETPEFS
jgi:hypothetical protein